MASVTIILVAADRVARADFPSKEGAGLTVLPHRAGTSTPAGVAEILAVRPVSQVWVLTEEVWSHSLTLPAPAVAGLDDAALTKALAYEAETFAGLSAENAALGFTRVGRGGGTLRQFWIALASHALRDEIQRAVKQAGGTLRGILHPGGLPGPLSRGNGGHWKRVEVWARAVLSLSGEGTTLERIETTGAGASRSNAALRPVGGAAETSEMLFGPGQDGAQPAAIPHVFRLNDEQALGGYLSAWYEQLNQSKPQVPFVAPVRAELPPYVFKFAGAAVLALAASVCALHFSMTREKIRALEVEAARYREPLQRLDAAKKSAIAIKQDLEKISAENKKRESDNLRVTTELGLQRNRMPVLMKELAARCPSDTVIDALTTDGDGIKIACTGLDPVSAENYAAALSLSLRPAGWSVCCVEKKARTGNGIIYWEFALEARATQMPSNKENTGTKLTTTLGGSAK